MDIFSFLTLFGGLAFFLFGMHLLSAGLEKLSGSKLESALKKMTSNTFKSLALGAGITIAIQSSSAVTVMLVGLVNSGIMEISQSVGIIMGSNIGTTMTAWILSLAGIESTNVFINLLKPKNFSPIIALIGIALLMMSKKQRRKDVGMIMLGFSVLMYGMELMSGAVAPLAGSQSFAGLLTAFKNPILGIVVGAAFTGIIQSSSASVGVLQALALTGSITYGMAVPIIMGQNIGTCVTALISSIGVSQNAKRVAAVHVSFNVIGTVIFYTLFFLVTTIFSLSFVDLPIGAAGVALCHSIFNIATTVILLPFTKQLERLSWILVRETKQEEKEVLIDERLLRSPSFAIAECQNLTFAMADTSQQIIHTALELFENWDDEESHVVSELEDMLDHYEDEIGSFLVGLSSKMLSDEDSRTISKLLHSIGDFERIGDHAVNLQESAQEMHKKEITFSVAAAEELEVIISALTEILSLAVLSFTSDDTELASHVEPLEEVIDGLVESTRMRHIARLKRGECTIELGFIFTDILMNIERVSDQCSNIAVCVIEAQKNSFDAHSYLHNIKASPSPDFTERFEYYRNKYMLP